MKLSRIIWNVLRGLFVGSAAVGRVSASLPPPEAGDAIANTRWDEIRRDSDMLALRDQLPPEVLQFLPNIGEFDLDPATAIRLSYAAAEPRDFAILDTFWKDRPEVAQDAEARRAFAETRRWLSASPSVDQDPVDTEVLLARVQGIAPRAPGADYGMLPNLWQVDDDDDDDDDDGGYDDD